MNPKNETMRLQSAEKLFERIEAHEEGRSWCSNGGLDKKAMTAPYTPPSNVAAWLRKHDIEHPKGRDYEALTKAAKRKPVGYWEDAPRGAKFGGGVGKALTDADEHGVTRAKPAPSSDSDLYEPIGTMPVVGDRIISPGHAQEYFRTPQMVTEACGKWGHVYTGEHSWGIGGFGSGRLRILKRKQPCVAGARAWRPGNSMGVLTDVVLKFQDGRLFRRLKRNWSVASPSWEFSDVTKDKEIHDPAEVARLVEEVRKAGLLK